MQARRTIHFATGSLTALLFMLGLATCGPAPGELGSQCTTDAECEGGACLSAFPGGYCSQRCEDVTCPADSQCIARPEGSFCLQGCESNISCRDGYTCQGLGTGSVCVPACQADAECGEGASCQDGQCIGSLPIGAGCSLNSVCESQRCEGSYNGGYCTAACAQEGPPGSSFNQDCPSGSQCQKVTEAGGLCLATCAGDTDCRADYFCDTVESNGTCRPRCRGNALCGIGYTCEPVSGRCLEGSALPRQTGSRCAADGDCDSSYCLDQPTTQFPGGVCSNDCTGNPGVCGESGLCLVPANPQAASVCLQKCGTNFDCRQDYFCSEVVGSTSRVCIPRCTAVDVCNSSEVCDQYSGDCVSPEALGSATVETVELGTLGAGTQKDFTLQVPADAISFTIVLKGGLGGTSIVSRLTSPSGEVLFDLEQYLESKVRILPVNDGDFGMLFPNSPRVAISAGTYRFTVLNENGTKGGDVSALVKRSTTSNLSNSRIDINLWFATSLFDATSARTNPSLNAALDMFRAIYGTAGDTPTDDSLGITLGNINYFDVPAAQASSYRVINSTEGADSELRRLFEFSAGAPNRALNFFLVDEISGGSEGFVILGIAGGIPGIPFVQGTNASGVAVTLLDLTRDPSRIGRVMAHEAGHWLGLWHVTEQNGSMHDPLPDTPECPPSRDADDDEVLNDTECADVNSDNLMFWLAGDSASKLSGNQGFVLQRNPAVTTP